MKKNICVITGTRAEYGLLRKLMLKLKNDKKLNLKLIVTGTHLSREFGYTYKEIEKDKFKINDKINIISNSDTPLSICKSIGIGVIEFAKSFKKIKPDVVVLLGDRFELLSAASASLVCQIPLAHLHGGETTLGAFDESIRHSITKMSHLHFVTTEVYKKRVIQMGENPKYVFNVGGFGVDAINSFKFSKKSEIEKKLNFQFFKKNIIVTYHPVTLDKNYSRVQINEILTAIKKFKDILFIFTMPNADTYGRIIIKSIKKYLKMNNNCVYFDSFGQSNYYNCLKYVDAILGNSSSGILEAPSFKIATINVGDRQKGRIQSKSIINVDVNSNEIFLAIKKIYSKNFKKILKKTISPYCKKNASQQVYKVLKKINIINIKKPFYDLF